MAANPCDQLSVDLSRSDIDVAIQTTPCIDVDLEQFDLTLSIGSAANQGPPGTQGEKGEKGDSGSVGPPGSPGVAATADAGTTTTGAPGTNALVTNRGTQNAALFDFLIPRGDVGATGPAGQGINIKGTVPGSGSLPPTGNNVGDMWIAADTGHGWVWNGTAWVDAGPIQGPPGEDGLDGTRGNIFLGDFPTPADLPPIDGVHIVGGDYAYVDSTGSMYVVDQTTNGAVVHGFNWLNVWNSATAYHPYDCVFRNGSSYIATVDNTNLDPATNSTTWNMMAASGTSGGGGGSGDMTRAVYDTDLDGIVDAAEVVPWTGVSGKPSSFPSDWSTLTGKPATFPPDSTAMLKSAYDTNSNNKVDAAENADAVPWTGVSSKPTTFPPDSTAELVARKGAANGYASLDSGTKIPNAQIGAIGSTTPSTGAFTTLSATGAVSGAGFTALLLLVPYDVALFAPGKPTASQLCMRFIFIRPISMPANFTGSVAKAATAATASTTFNIAKNGSNIGTLVFAAAGTTGTFTVAGGATFVSGDILAVTAPASPDTTLADISATLTGTRT